MVSSNNINVLAKNTIWNAIETYSVVVIQLLSTFLLAHYLTPADFGIVGMLMIFTAIAQTFVDSGFGATLIREKTVPRVGYSSVFYVNLLIAIILYVTLFCLSNSIASFYNKPILGKICKYSFIVIPLNALCIVQIAILKRNLQFKKLCFISLISSIVSCVLSIVIAFIYKNVWALVIQNVALFSIKTILLWISCRWKPQFSFSSSLIRKYFSFSKNIMIAGLIGSVFNNIYSLLIGKFFTPTDVGYFSQADRMKNVASHTSSSVIQNVTYPILAKINNEGGNIRNAYKQIISVTMLFVGCIMVMLISIAPDLFELLMYNPSWRKAGFFFQLLGISGILFPLHVVNQNILMVVGKSQTLMYLEIGRRLILIIIILLTFKTSIAFFVFGNSIYSIILLFLNLYYCGKPIDYGVIEQLKDIFPILWRQCLMVLVGFLISASFSNYPIYLRLILPILSVIITGYILFHKNPYYMKIESYIKDKYHTVLLNWKR